MLPEDRLIDAIALMVSNNPLPSEDLVRDRVVRYSIMDVAAIVGAIRSTKQFRIVLPAASSVFSSFECPDDITKLLIRTIDKYYPDITHEIEQDENMSQKFVDVIQMLVEEVIDGSIR